MAIDFGALLSAEEKKSLLDQRLKQFAAEAYQHELNKQVAAASNQEDAVEQSNAALAILESAITVHQAELASLDLPAADPAE